MKHSKWSKLRKHIQNFMITNSIDGEFDKATLNCVAMSVVEKVLKDLFMRDVKIMVSNAVWNQYVGESNGTLIIKKDKAKEILARYIRIGSQRRRANGSREWFYWVEDFMLSGIVMMQTVQREVLHEPELLQVVTMKARLTALRAAA